MRRNNRCRKSLNIFGSRCNNLYPFSQQLPGHEHRSLAEIDELDKLSSGPVSLSDSAAIFYLELMISFLQSKPGDPPPVPAESVSSKARKEVLRKNSTFPTTVISGQDRFPSG